MSGTPWKGGLLEELYMKGAEVFDRKLTSGRIDERMAERLKEVSRILEGEVGEAHVIDYFKSLPARYFSAARPEVIAGHIMKFRGLKENPISISIEHHRELGFSTVTVCTLDLPGLFSRITGAMAANSVNILNAQIYTRNDGTVIDILSVSDPFGRLIEDERKWQELKNCLVSVIEGRAHVDALLAKKTRPPIIREKVRPKHSAIVEVDNLVSDTYTVIEIYAHDRVGLLYSITSTLARLGLYIDVAKIATKGDQAADVFYVKDIFGHKIADQTKLDRIKTEILKVV